MARTLTDKQQGLLDAVKSGAELPDDAWTRRQLVFLRGRGFLTRERGEHGDTFTAGNVTPAANQRRRRKRKQGR